MAACTYCDDPQKDSISHIIPEALANNGPALDFGVCDRCNHAFNSEVENHVIRQFFHVRNLLQLTDKRGAIPRLNLEARYGDQTMRYTMTDLDDLADKVFVFKNAKDSQGVEKAITIISRDQESLEEHRRKYENKHPETNFRPIQVDVINAGLQHWLQFDMAIFADTKCLRMVAKIALEWWCKQRHLEGQRLSEHREIVEYIMDATPAPHPIVSIMMDPEVLPYITQVPFPMHTFVISLDPLSLNVVILFGLFSIVYYKVIITTRHASLAREDRLFTVHPQTGHVYEPLLRGSLSPGPYISSITRADYLDPLEVIKQHQTALLKRLNLGIGRVIQTMNPDQP
jgi:hypothetical protein